MASLPIQVAHAIVRAQTLPVADAQVRLLSILIGFADRLDPTKEIFVRRDTLAGKVSKSVDTITRILGELEADGWISRSQARNGLAFGSVLVRLSEKLLALVWGPAKSSENQQQTCGQLPSSRPSEMTTVNKVNQQSFTRDNLSENSSRQGEQKNQNQRQVASHLPDDLKSLDGKLSMPAIWKLMGMASKKGKRLGDVVAATAKHWAKFSGRQLFAYLSKLVESDKDFGYIVKREAQEKAVVAQKSALETKKELLNGKIFKSSATGQFYRVSKGLVEFIGRSMYAQLAKDFIDQIESGGLVECSEIS